MQKSTFTKYRKNIVFLTLHLMFSKRVTGPVMMLLYQFFGLSYGQIGILSSIVWFTDAAVEIFGGAISDVYGRKTASLTYGLLGMTSMLLFIFGNSFAYFAAANIAYGLALAIGSGNASALLFDTLAALGIENQFKRYRGRIKFPVKVLNAIIILLLPYLYLNNIKYPFLLGFFLYLISFITASLLVEPPRVLLKSRSGIIKAVTNAFREIGTNKTVILALALDMIFSGFILLVYEYFQPIINIAGVPLQYFGIIYFLTRISEGVGGLLLHKLERHPNKRLLILNAIMLLLSVVGFAVGKSYTLIAFMLVFCLISGASDILMSDVINKNISSNNRTTIVSTGNMLNSLAVSVTLFIFGFASDRYGVQGMFGIAALVYGTLLAFLSLVLKSRMVAARG